jgi:hypothetical protein
MARAALFERVARGNFESFVSLVRAQHAELKSRFGVAQRRALRMLMRGDAFGHGWLITVNAVPAGFVIVSLGYSVEYGGRSSGGAGSAAGRCGSRSGSAAAGA